MKHKIVEMGGNLVVKEKKSFFSKWVFVDRQGLKTHQTFNKRCFVDGRDHAERIVTYRKKINER